MRILRLIIATVSVIAAFVAPATAAHADTTTKTYTTLPASVSPHWIAPGDSATVSGTLLLAGEPSPGQTVVLRARTPWRADRFVTVDSAVTAADGTVSFTVSPQHRTIYRLRFAGNSEAYGTISHRMAVRMMHPTALRAGAAENSNGALVAGRLMGRSHGLPGRIVVLQSNDGSGWVDVTSRQTNRRGKVHFLVDGSAQYRLSFVGTRRYLPSTSPIVTFG